MACGKATLPKLDEIFGLLEKTGMRRDRSPISVSMHYDYLKNVGAVTFDFRFRVLLYEMTQTCEMTKLFG